MDIDFSRILTTLDGKPMTEDGRPLTITNEKGEVVATGAQKLTLKAVALGSLVGPTPVDPRTGMPLEAIPSDEQLRRYKIGFMIQDAGGPVELTSDDVVLLKKVIASRHSWPLLVGQALMMLENAQPDKPAKAKKSA